MHPQLFVPPLCDEDRQALWDGLRSAEAFTARRCQILLASADGKSASAIAFDLHCTRPTVRNAIHAFARDGRACLREKSSRPHSARPLLGPGLADPLKEVLHQRPRAFGKPTSLWTLDAVADVCHANGWTPRVVSGETVRQALKRLNINWRRAKRWITSPDPAYARKKNGGTG